MTETKIEQHIQRYSEIVERVLDNGRSLQSPGGSEADLATIAMVREDLSELRAQLAQPSRTYLGCRIIEHDYEALIELCGLSSESSWTTHSIAVNDVGRITSVNLRGSECGSINGIEYLSHLKSVRLENVDVIDCCPLSKLTYLKSFASFSNTNLNMSTFGAMKSLDRFICDQSCIGDLSWVSGCPNIKYLSVGSCHIDSIEGLGSCKQLQSLEIPYNPIISITPLKGHSSIRVLNIEHTAITDFSPLISMPSLRELYISLEMAELPSFQAYRKSLKEKGVLITELD